MSLPTFPFETSEPFLRRTWRSAIRPLRVPRTVWHEIYRGDSLLAPLGFACLGLALAAPCVLGAAALGIAALRRVMGPESVLVLAEVLRVAPGILATFLLGPALMGLLAGCLAHGVLWLLDPGVRGRLRGSLRAFLYAYAWSLPWTAAVTGGSLFFLCNPLAGIRLDPDPAHWMIRAASPALLTFEGFALLALAGTLAMTAWALAALHRSAWWKALLAAVLGLGIAGLAGQILAVQTDRRFVRAVVAHRDQKVEQVPGPADRMRRLMETVEKLQTETQTRFRKAGLPDPPRGVDVLTGGDWGAGIDLGQAVQSGFLPSCQRIYTLTQGALRGQAIFMSDCLGEAHPSMPFPLPDPLMPPGSAARAAEIRQHLTPERREALARTRTACLQTLGWMESTLGPFPAEPPEPRPAAAEGRQPGTSPDDQTLPSAPLSERIPVAELRAQADQGNPAAMNELGRKYFFGQDIPDRVDKDRALGLRWMERAYQAGFRSVESCTCLMASYATGLGVPQDREASERWRSRANAIQDAARRASNQGR